jgi:flagellar hook-associated protein 2
MATISSPGIGSGLNVKDIVSQLVALEKRPLEGLKLQAATVQTKISAFGQIKSLVSTLSDAAGKLSSVTGWNAVSATSSDSKAVSVTAIGGTLPTSFSVEVQSLAKAQATASAALLPVGGALGAGTIRLELGQWSVVPSSFTPGSGTPIDITITATDKVSDIASKINGANAGVTATVLSDASGERLLLRGKNTGIDAGFRLSVTDNDGVNDDASGLSRLVAGVQYTEEAANAEATINGIPVTSATNTFANTVSGVTFKALQETTAPVELTVAKDTSTASANIEAFVNAYNAINQLLNEATKYDGGTKTAGLLQGDSTALTLQNALRGAIQAVNSKGGVFQRLADIGVTQQRGGDLSIDSTKLTAALQDPDNVKNLFRSEDGKTGIAETVKALAVNLLASDGFFKTKEDSLKLNLQRNTKDQARVNEKAASTEAALNRRYSALDAQLANLNGLNAYIAQQVTAWNNMGSK